jgi:hypothetical protein
MLLGFLLQGDQALQAQAAARLRAGSLAPLVAVLHSSLAFYMKAGAITDVSRDVLFKLLQELAAAVKGQALEQQAAAAAAAQG